MNTISRQAYGIVWRDWYRRAEYKFIQFSAVASPALRYVPRIAGFFFCLILVLFVAQGLQFSMDLSLTLIVLCTLLCAVLSWSLLMIEHPFQSKAEGYSALVGMFILMSIV
jgi:hypothetical protein